MNGDDQQVALLEAAAGGPTAWPSDGLAELAVGGVPVRGASASTPRRGG